MGFLKWIKRELDSSHGGKRRQSEPPLSINHTNFSRDESYIKALSKFNEWRDSKRFGSAPKLTRKSFRKALRRKRSSKAAKEIPAKPLDGEEDEYEDKEEDEAGSDLHTDNELSITNGNNFYEEIPQSVIEEGNKIKAKTATRHSFPVNRIQRNKVVQSDSPHSAKTIYENDIYEFEDHCLNQSRSLDLSQSVSSPPVKFYKENSNPFANVLSPLRPIVYAATPSQLSFCNSIEDQSSQQSEKRTSNLDIEEIKSDTDDNSSRKSQKYLPYQTVINKHGDEVEYALPFNERLGEVDYYDSSPDADKSKICNLLQTNTSPLETTNGYQQYVEENFKFLNLSKPNLSRSIVQVTDLDKTEGTIKNIEDNDILQEIESLEMWTKSIGICQSAKKRASLENVQPIVVEHDLQNTELLVCTLNSIKISPEAGSQSYINGSFYAGTFHNVPVTQFVPHSDDNELVGKMLRLNFDVLRKIRHPDIALLMGVSADASGKLDSLILEPLQCSLNHLIHKEKIALPLAECLSYVNQVLKAATFIHESGWVHSNISSHTIMVSQHQNIVKLTSFELASKNDENIRSNISLNFSGSLQKLDLRDMPYQYLPYCIDYRQMYSEHFYQPPELLATESKFVFATKQADIYGIVLALWEMLNCSVPFALFTSEDMKKLFYLRHAQLPTFRHERCKHFEGILQKGLEISPEDRIKDTLSLGEMLSKIELVAKNNVSVSSGGFPVLSPKTCGNVIYERTSTIKNRKNNIYQNRINAKQLFISNFEKPQEGDDSPKSADYQFEIGEISLPDTPIARSNKLRKNAWLASKSISPIVQLDVNSPFSKLDAIDEQKISNSQTPSNKTYKVSTITILQSNEKDSDQPPDSGDVNKSNISNQIKYWNALTTVSTPNNKVHSEPELCDSPTDNNAVMERAPSPQSSENQSDDEHLSEVFYKNHLSSTNDFENSLWRREKQKCEQSSSLLESNGVHTPRRISVKDAVNKFESFTKSFSSDISEKNLSQKLLKNNYVASKSMILIENVQSVEAENEAAPPQPDAVEEKHESISKLSVTLSNNIEENNNAVKKLTKNSINNLHRINLRETIPEPPQSNHPMLLTLNFKKLDRRASDVGSYVVQPIAMRRDRVARHSIYGSEIFKRLNKIRNTEGDKNVATLGASNRQSDANSFQNSKKDFQIKVGRITCVHCGHKLFIVDDVEKSENNEHVKGSRSELVLTPLKRSNNMQPAKSTEDLYIDDDYCEDIELGANMELGTRSEYFDFIDWDYDILSADVYNPTDEFAV